MHRASLNTPHPWTSNPDGRRKDRARIAGNGRGPCRIQGPIELTLTQLPATAPPPVARVGTRIVGSFVCHGCRRHVNNLVRQLPGSAAMWVCAEFCSPRDPRHEPFISTVMTNA